ncbi:MAG TPA: PIN domain-containing protein [Gammaproteobacteria bacterium]|jgi:predicted nucleic acid-binding protein
MAANVLVDAGFLVALLARRDAHHPWAVRVAERFPPPWRTCEAVLSETFHLLGARGAPTLRGLLRRGALLVTFDLGDNIEPVLKVLEKYADRAASLADACLVRMSEMLATPMLLTTDGDFRFYRRHGRQVIPCQMPD